jgi:putative colanic acid biosynthesis acetyltransferase WcaF
MEYIVQKLNRFTLPENFRGRSKIQVQLWWIVNSIFFNLSPQVFYGWRRVLLRLFGANIGKHVLIRPTAQITYPWKVTIGDHSWIGDYVTLYSLGNIEIGKNVVISQKSYLCTGSHDPTDVTFRIWQKPIIIEDEAWIATDVYVGPGVLIGRGSVIGARSSVFKDMPAGMVCLGNPAKPVKPR